MTLPSLKDPVIVLLGIVLVIVLILLGFKWYEAHSLQRELTETTTKLDKAKADIAVLQSQRDGLAAANRDFVRAVAAQNDAIAKLKAEGEARQARAAAAARAALADRAPLPEGHGPEIMNRWLVDTLRPSLQ